MKAILIFLAFATVAYAGFIPPMINKGFMPIPEAWHSSAEEDDESGHYDHHHHDFEDHPKTIHVHEDHGHFNHHHFEDSHEHHSPAVVNYHEHPKTVHIHEKPEVHVIKEPKTVHVHEHHHHHHHHVKTLPVSIIKKTVYIKHG